MNTTATPRLPLRRPRTGRIIAGVCQGLAAHLGIPVRTVRIVAVVLAICAGIGAVFYIWLWLTVPEGDPADDAKATRPATLSRLVPAVTGGRSHEDGDREDGGRVGKLPVTDIAVGLILLTVAGILIATQLGVDISVQWVWPVLIALGGLGLAWSQLDEARRARWLRRAGGRTPVSVVRLLGGITLVIVGVLLLIARGETWEVALRSAVAAIAVLGGAALVLAPWLLGLIRDLGTERAARIREAERADIAAHLHDSVLQTLALIRKRADEPEIVRRLARAQERELRAWLYEDRVSEGTSVEQALRDIVAEVEDALGQPIDVVVVGDCRPDMNTEALLLAVREALRNAVRHGRPPVTVFLEVTEDEVEASVKDRGDGFDLTDVPQDRLGVRESVIGRIERRGGKARVRSGDGGTEVLMTMPLIGGSTEERTNP